jgi:acetyl-CoA carboxylase carboxyltransferase component
MTAASSSKVTRFLRLANTYHLPVITLVDVPGFIATQAESEGQILSKGAALLMMYPNVMVPRISVVIDKAFGGAYCAMGSITTETERSRFCRHYGFPTGQIAVVGKEAGPFFTYGFNAGDVVMKDRQQQRYETEYLNMDMAFAKEFVVPLEPEDLRKRLLDDVPKLYASYQDYWGKLVKELKFVQEKCHYLYKELRYGAIRGFIKPL